ncbi:hypothetical protein [Halobacterium sp. R2-5]|uniref:hypothetical protein n=1 Tax=Halobacterium sp. R2-5 TaxID=2715751 RepID=UPI00141E2060|nr:hypothetical protein [Halobacterium sp. R2-5]NIB98414.1 hypothetical protein [Halobacterium sp. R2-5]
MATLGKSASRASTVSTIIDAAMSFRRGKRKRGLLLLGAAALSRRIPGLGTLASILVRVSRRFR